MRLRVFIGARSTCGEHFGRGPIHTCGEHFRGGAIHACGAVCAVAATTAIPGCDMDPGRQELGSQPTTRQQSDE
eukprot:350841-Chlamydomonas_euryale.AAC.5